MWKLAGVVCAGGPLKIDNLDVWKHEWHSVDEKRASVLDPQYGRPYSLKVYTITDGTVTVKFATGEFSNGM